MMIIVIKFYCIAPHPFQSGGVDVEVLFQNDENVTVVATITFMVGIYNDIQTQKSNYCTYCVGSIYM